MTEWEMNRKAASYRVPGLRDKTRRPRRKKDGCPGRRIRGDGPVKKTRMGDESRKKFMRKSWLFPKETSIFVFAK